MGHKDVSTTMIYTHVMKRPGFGTRSPRDLPIPVAGTSEGGTVSLRLRYGYGKPTA